jgi:hypothetical protein
MVGPELFVITELDCNSNSNAFFWLWGLKVANTWIEVSYAFCLRLLFCEIWIHKYKYQCIRSQIQHGVLPFSDPQISSMRITGPPVRAFIQETTDNEDHR